MDENHNDYYYIGQEKLLLEQNENCSNLPLKFLKTASA